MDIINYLQIEDKLATSGQPQEGDFPEIAKLGYEIVINLALSTAENAISDEDSIVTLLGMNFVHIPVVWEAPTQEQFNLFVHIMNYYAGRRIWIHCALNMRVSCFMYLYRTRFLGASEEIAKKSMLAIWQPNSVWSEYMYKISRDK